MKFLDYIFYRAYRFQLLVGNYLTPVFSTLIGLTCVLMFNLFSLLFLFSFYTDLLLLIFKSSIKTAIIFFIIIFLSLSTIFLYRKRYKNVIQAFKNESKNDLKKGNIQVFIYLVFTLLILYISLYLMYIKNN
jgi:uncharacterized membrane protein YbhN (UPF0104 family)